MRHQDREVCQVSEVCEASAVMDLSIKVMRGFSGASEELQGFKCDNLTSRLEERVLHWVSQSMGLDVNDINVKLLVEDSEIQVHPSQTLSEAGLVHGSLVTVIVEAVVEADSVEADSLPPLIHSSDDGGSVPRPDPTDSSDSE